MGQKSRSEMKSGHNIAEHFLAVITYYASCDIRTNEKYACFKLRNRSFTIIPILLQMNDVCKYTYLSMHKLFIIT